MRKDTIIAIVIAILMGSFSVFISAYAAPESGGNFWDVGGTFGKFICIFNMIGYSGMSALAGWAIYTNIKTELS